MYSMPLMHCANTIKTFRRGLLFPAIQFQPSSHNPLPRNKSKENATNNITDTEARRGVFKRHISPQRNTSSLLSYTEQRFSQFSHLRRQRQWRDWYCERRQAKASKTSEQRRHDNSSHPLLTSFQPPLGPLGSHAKLWVRS